MADSKKSRSTEKPKKVKAPKDPNAPKATNETLKGASKLQTIRVQGRPKDGKFHMSVTKITKSAKEGEKSKRQVGALGVVDTREEALAWTAKAVAKLKELGWKGRGDKSTKADAFDLDSLPAPDADVEETPAEAATPAA